MVMFLKIKLFMIQDDFSPAPQLPSQFPPQEDGRGQQNENPPTSTGYPASVNQQEGNQNPPSVSENLDPDRVEDPLAEIYGEQNEATDNSIEPTNSPPASTPPPAYPLAETPSSPPSSQSPSEASGPQPPHLEQPDHMLPNSPSQNVSNGASPATPSPSKELSSDSNPPVSEQLEPGLSQPDSDNRYRQPDQPDSLGKIAGNLENKLVESNETKDNLEAGEEGGESISSLPQVSQVQASQPDNTSASSKSSPDSDSSSRLPDSSSKQDYPEIF